MYEKNIFTSTGKLSLCSVSMSMPTIQRPHNGVFIRRRLSQLSTVCNITAIMPSPWFPLLSRTELPADDIDFPVSAKRMFYVPAVLKQLDAYWMRRAIHSLVTRMHRLHKFDAIDAHFGYPTGAACCEIGKSLGIPTFVTIRGVEQRQLKQKQLFPR